MGKTLVIVFLAIALLFAFFAIFAGLSSAWHHRHHYYGGVVFGPPFGWCGPPEYGFGYRPYWGGNYRIYHGPYYVPSAGYWVPGHWEYRLTPYGWQNIWIPGYWRYGF